MNSTGWGDVEEMFDSAGADLGLDELVPLDALIELVTLMWSSYIDEEIPLDVVGSGATPSDRFIAQVDVHGPQPCRVSLAMGHETAWDAAVRMVRQTGIEISNADDVRDAVGELVNILGGNIKALLPDGAALGLPHVAREGELSSVPRQISPEQTGTDTERVGAVLMWGSAVMIVAVTMGASVTGHPVGGENAARPADAPSTESGAVR